MMRSQSTSPRQTQSYLRQLFAKRGLHPKNKLGQCFLVDLNLLDLILREAELSPADLAWEVGTGTGSLTARLAQHAGAVLSVEVDPAFYALANENVPSREHVHLVCADVLRNKNRLNPEILAELEKLLGQSGCRQIKLVANLPYAVATPVIANVLLTDLPVERLVVTVQWEIAERLLARPGTKDFGALSVLVQSLADVELIRRLSPTVFWPRPRVESAIVRMVPSAAKQSRVPDKQRLRSFLRGLYSHRRKNLRGALISVAGRSGPKGQIDAKLACLGLDGACRAETLSVEDHLQLCEAFAE